MRISKAQLNKIILEEISEINNIRTLHEENQLHENKFLKTILKKLTGAPGDAGFDAAEQLMNLTKGGRLRLSVANDLKSRRYISSFTQNFDRYKRSVLGPLERISEIFNLSAFNMIKKTSSRNRALGALDSLNGEAQKTIGRLEIDIETLEEFISPQVTGSRAAKEAAADTLDTLKDWRDVVKEHKAMFEEQARMLRDPKIRSLDHEMVAFTQKMLGKRRPAGQMMMKGLGTTGRALGGSAQVLYHGFVAAFRLPVFGIRNQLVFLFATNVVSVLSSWALENEWIQEKLGKNWVHILNLVAISLAPLLRVMTYMMVGEEVMKQDAKGGELDDTWYEKTAKAVGGKEAGKALNVCKDKGFNSPECKDAKEKALQHAKDDLERRLRNGIKKDTKLILGQLYFSRYHTVAMRNFEENKKHMKIFGGRLGGHVPKKLKIRYFKLQKEFKNRLQNGGIDAEVLKKEINDRQKALNDVINSEEIRTNIYDVAINKGGDAFMRIYADAAMIEDKRKIQYFIDTGGQLPEEAMEVFTTAVAEFAKRPNYNLETYCSFINDTFIKAKFAPCPDGGSALAKGWDKNKEAFIPANECWNAQSIEWKIGDKLGMMVADYKHSFDGTKMITGRKKQHYTLCMQQAKTGLLDKGKEKAMKFMIQDVFPRVFYDSTMDAAKQYAKVMDEVNQWILSELEHQ